MAKNILFVLGGLAMGGVETYVVRMASELQSHGHSVTVVILSNKSDPLLLQQLKSVADVHVIEYFSFLGASSWLNALVPSRAVAGIHFDVVHVVDLLTLAYVYFQRKKYSFDAMTIGIYHSREIMWWRGRGVYFRSKMLELYDQNAELTLFPNESTAVIAARYKALDFASLKILPLGISLERYASASPCQRSLKLVSVGRLVDFKVYNRHVISILADLRQLASFEYYIYGDGPERESLVKLAEASGVAQFVHFKGGIQYSELASVLDGAFCFIGSGTTLIEASAAGVPSIVGIESIPTPDTCGFFSDVEGYSYNELSATDYRVSIRQCIASLVDLDEQGYQQLALAHRKKASEFDIKSTSKVFVDVLNRAPNFDISFSRCRAVLSFVWSVLTLGPRALKSRFDSE